MVEDMVVTNWRPQHNSCWNYFRVLNSHAPMWLTLRYMVTDLPTSDLGNMWDIVMRQFWPNDNNINKKGKSLMQFSLYTPQTPWLYTPLEFLWVGKSACRSFSIHPGTCPHEAHWHSQSQIPTIACLSAYRILLLIWAVKALHWDSPKLFYHSMICFNGKHTCRLIGVGLQLHESQHFLLTTTLFHYL